MLVRCFGQEECAPGGRWTKIQPITQANGVRQPQADPLKERTAADTGGFARGSGPR
jgi:hypothetical protein